MRLAVFRVRKPFCAALALLALALASCAAFAQNADDGFDPNPNGSVGGLALQPDGTFSVDVAPTQTMQYRLSSGTIKSGVLQVVVAAA